MAVRRNRRRRNPSGVIEATRELSSPGYDRHVTLVTNLDEAAKRLPAKSSSKKSDGAQSLSLAWDDVEYQQIPGVRRRDGLLTDKERKKIYYDAYISNPWVSACCEVIAKRFTSGGWEVEEKEQGKGSDANRDKLKTLLLFVNENEDFLQFLRSIAVDLNIYGEAYCEIVYEAGVPAQLHKVDCATMDYRIDMHGNLLGYTQTLDRSTQIIEFEPDQIIRWWFPDARASMKALSPIEKIKDAIYLYSAMITWSQKFFKQGARPAFGLIMGEDSSIDDAKRYIKFFKENYTGVGNSHVPPVSFGGAKFQEFGKGPVEQDFIKGLDKQRDTILSGYNVPLSLVGVQETAQLGSGSGESANKAFIYNTVKPIEQLILEKLNFRLQKAFNIDDYIISVRHADYRDDATISTIHDRRIRNGSRLIDEVRQEEGKPAYPKGGGVPIFAVSKEVIPVETFDTMVATSTQNTQLDLDTKAAQLDKIKNPPAPPPTMPGQPNQNKQQPPKSAKERLAHILDSLDMGTPLREEHIMDAISAMLQVNMEAKDDSEEEDEEGEQPA